MPSLQTRRTLIRETEAQGNQAAVTASQGGEEAGRKQRPLTFLSYTGTCVLNDCTTTRAVFSPHAQTQPFPARRAEPTRLPFGDVLLPSATFGVSAPAVSRAVSCLVRAIQGPLDSENGRE